MFDLEVQVMPQIIEQRQAYLRSLAGHRPHEIAPEPIRRRAGRTLVRLGRWIEGRCPDEPTAMLPTFKQPATKLAGSMK